MPCLELCLNATQCWQSIEIHTQVYVSLHFWVQFYDKRSRLDQGSLQQYFWGCPIGCTRILRLRLAFEMQVPRDAGYRTNGLDRYFALLLPLRTGHKGPTTDIHQLQAQYSGLLRCSYISKGPSIVLAASVYPSQVLCGPSLRVATKRSNDQAHLFDILRLEEPTFQKPNEVLEYVYIQSDIPRSTIEAILDQAYFFCRKTGPKNAKKRILVCGFQLIASIALH